ncbi:MULTISPECIES: chemotaxis protein CheW [unclassified Actinotalea]|uniref:chemotaxis protein CheW n=1 Tax=unclassified Actinotalea TaxID=2638618 RepID=UPI0015F56017|nr:MULTISPECIES: chemotaxis protein CheW [unclassified Actinotalea]
MSRQLATFTLEGAHYGVDVMRVQEALRFQPRTAVPMAPAAVAGLVNLRGQVVLTIDLRVCLGLDPLPPSARPMMVVVQVGGEPISLLVDEIGDVIDVDDDAFEMPPDTLAPSLRGLVTGAFKLEDRLLLALDVDRAVAA